MRPQTHIHLDRPNNSGHRRGRPPQQRSQLLAFLGCQVGHMEDMAERLHHDGPGTERTNTGLHHPLVGSPNATARQFAPALRQLTRHATRRGFPSIYERMPAGFPSRHHVRKLRPPRHSNNAGGCGVRSPVARLERRLTLGPVPGQQLVHPRSGHHVGDGDLGRLTALNGNGGDDQTGSRHPCGLEDHRPLRTILTVSSHRRKAAGGGAPAPTLGSGKWAP